MQGIGNFAESLILGELEAPQKKKATNESSWGDIRDVEVSDSFRNQLIESATSEDPNSVAISLDNEGPEEVPIAEPTPIADVESSSEDLVKRLESLLSEFKEVLSEITTTGMLGVNLSPPKETKKKKSAGKKKLKLVIKGSR